MAAKSNGSVLLTVCGGTFPVNNILKSCGLAVAVISLSACATITRGTKETFKVVTTPTAAAVALSTGERCTSPCSLKLKRKTEFTVTATKNGYKPATVKIESKIKGGGVAGAAGNIIFGGIIGGVVDGTNGSMRDLTPNPLYMTLQQADGSPAASLETAVPTTAVAAESISEAPAAASDGAAVAVPAPGSE